MSKTWLQHQQGGREQRFTSLRAHLDAFKVVSRCVKRLDAGKDNVDQLAQLVVVSIQKEKGGVVRQEMRDEPPRPCAPGEPARRTAAHDSPAGTNDQALVDGVDVVCHVCQLRRVDQLLRV